MSPQQTHSQMANFIWSICNLLRGPYKRNEYRKVILPLTVLRRFDCILAGTKAKVLKEYDKWSKKYEKKAEKPEAIIDAKLKQISGVPFYNLAKYDFDSLTDDSNQIGANLTTYMKSFSSNIREIFEKFDFEIQINKMNEKNLLFEVIKEFASDKIDLSPDNIDNMQMGYIFEELIRIGAEQANEEAGEHFTPREVIKLMVNLLLDPEDDLRKSHVVKTIYDPACGTGGMLSVAEKYIRDLNEDAQPYLFGQDYNDEAWAVCRSDMLIKGEEANNIKLGDTFLDDGFKDETFDYMLANPPFGVEWKQQSKSINAEKTLLGYDGRFGAGTPRINDGSLLFLQHMISKMQPEDKGGSRIAIVFNGSPLFTGDAGSGESNIRQWIIENDLLEAVVALPDQLFYNTGISTYVWVLSNRKESRREEKIQLIDARQFYLKMRKSLGNKRNCIGDETEGQPDQIGEITRIYGNFKHDETRDIEIAGKTKTVVVSKIFDNDDFGYHKITVERPLRLNFKANDARIALIEEETAFKNLAASKKKSEAAKKKDIEAGKKRQEEIRKFLQDLKEVTKGKLYKDRDSFTMKIIGLNKTIDPPLAGNEIKIILSALSEKDETAKNCTKPNGSVEADPELRDTENVPLKEDIHEYFKREVLPHAPGAWIDEKKTKVGYELPLNRHFYRYEPPRDLGIIEKDISVLEKDIVRLLADVTGSTKGLK